MNLVIIPLSLFIILTRWGAVHYTRKAIQTGKAIEGNWFMKESINNNLQMLFNIGCLLFTLNALVIAIPNPLTYFMVILILMFCWIDFQHDWEIYHQIRDKQDTTYPDSHKEDSK